MSATSKHAREEEIEEHVERKKRRIVTPAKSSEKTPLADKVDSKLMPRALFNLEENEVLQRNASDDVEMHREVVEEVTSIMTKIKNIKRSNISEDKKKEAVKKLQKEAVLHFMSLKRLNRIGHLRCKKIREITQEVKQKVDQKQLSLQNFLYELMHLQREISKCVQFKSMDEEISLVSQEEFLRAAPAEITEKLLKENDGHKMMMARLDWELKERKALAAKYADSLKTKGEIQKEIEKLKSSLKSLNPMLANVLESTKPIQEHLDMPFDENETLQRTAGHLPPPLYFLFIQASSYGKACDKSVSVEVVGDAELAQSVEKMDSPIDEESESDDESEQTNKVHRRSTTDSRLTKRQEQLLKMHPLSVSLKVTSGDKGSITLSFQYLINLDFVVVSAEIQLGPGNGEGRDSSEGKEGSVPTRPEPKRDLFEPLLFLDSLYDGEDDGEETPNPENVFKLAKFGITDLASQLKDVGRPYKWVQRLCGLQNLAQNPSRPGGDSNLGRRGRVSNIEELVGLLKTRFDNRTELLRQLEVLDGTNERPAVDWMPTYNFSNVPRKISSQLVQWRSSSYKEFVESPVTENIRKYELVSPKDFFYFGLLERAASATTGQQEGRDGKATLAFFVALSPDYPNSLPVFCIRVSCGNIERNALDDENLRELEGTVNLRSSQDLDIRNALLNQVALLSACFDVYLETGGLGVPREVSANPFEGDKSFLRTTRGPMRSKPYRYVDRLGFFGHF